MTGLTPGRLFTAAGECAGMFRRARKTLRAMWFAPMGPKRIKAMWPEVQRRLWHDEAPTRTRVMRTHPTPEAIDEVDRVIGWATVLDVQQSKIFLARLQGVPWRIIGRNEGLSRRTAHRKLVACFYKIAICEKKVGTFGRKKACFRANVTASCAGEPGAPRQAPIKPHENRADGRAPATSNGCLL